MSFFVYYQPHPTWDDLWNRHMNAVYESRLKRMSRRSVWIDLIEAEACKRPPYEAFTPYKDPRPVFPKLVGTIIPRPSTR